FDHRRVTTQGQNQRYEHLPIWQTNTGHNVSSSYCSDDILAMMADGSGLNFGGDKLDIAVGRISARTADEARVFVDRLIKYCNAPIAGEWRNHVMLLADDQDSGTHMNQTETMFNNMQSYDSGLGMMYTKVYIDEFEFSNSMYAGARDKMYRTLNNGVAWWNYIGHGGSTTLTADKQFETSDLYSLYLRHAPVFYAATCTFGRWDDVEQCGIEALTLEESGGAVAAISATRPVYISLNGVLSASLGLEAFARDENGRFRTVGEIINRAKNAMTNDDLNKRRYVLLGDPAMRLMVPENHAVLESIDGVEVTDENQVTVSALQRPVFRGSIYDTGGRKMTSFNGTVSLTLYDAEYSSTTRGRGTEKDPGAKVTFEQQGNRLYAGSGIVTGGEFAVTIPMPAEVSDNFRPAALNMYARAESGEEASGMNRDFYVYGFDDTAQPDTVPPTIDRIYINHESFRNGDAVNTTPTLIVSVSDDVGINLSNSGVGHQMAVSVDGKLSYNNVAAYYTPAEDGSAGGTVIFPLGTLSNGHHELTFKVWDTSSNSSAAVIELNVVERQDPKILDAYYAHNPASVEANFYVSHNRPDAMLTVTVDILDLDGRLLWSDSNKGRADMFLSSPIHWDLCNSAGHRVPRGIYIYRVTVSSGSGENSSISKRIAVTGQ
ncbi:MAG: type IX secretion system sortase PorU, partial [Duncaniella sp.]|nr:type IX secretion system sortase PorU [Duncaniella sp.]